MNIEDLEMSSKQIAIVTFPRAHNFGGFLQAYALQTYLEKEGHKPFFVNYQYKWDHPFRGGLRAWFSRTPRVTAMKINYQLQSHIFLDSQKKHLNINPYLYKGGMHLQDEPPDADVFMCGSDQIWNPDAIFEEDEPAVWLGFGDDTVRRIAYAASFCVFDLDDTTRSRWSSYIKRFHAVSVRERDGVDMTRMLGYADAVWVPDPTLLLDASDYYHLEPKTSGHDTPYLFSYQLGTDTAHLFTKIKATMLEVLGINCRECQPQSFTHNLFRGGFIGPSEWLSRLHRSDNVITNSFHGVVFSLIFHRPFIVMLRQQTASRMNSRVISILDTVGLQHRAISTYDRVVVERLCREEIDWDMVDAKLMEFRERGVQFLREALS